jgi:hypothetical protein
MAIRPEVASNEGHVQAAFGEDSGEAVGQPTCLLDENYEESFAFRAARVSAIRGFHVAHDPDSRGDFLQALQLLGAEPNISRLQRCRSTCRIMRVHVSCSRDNWIEIFGEPECVEEIVVPSTKHVLNLWKHSCSDGLVTCIGHLFEQSPGVRWIVVTRIALL